MLLLYLHLVSSLMDITCLLSHRMLPGWYVIIWMVALRAGLIGSDYKTCHLWTMMLLVLFGVILIFTFIGKASIGPCKMRISFLGKRLVRSFGKRVFSRVTILVCRLLVHLILTRIGWLSVQWLFLSCCDCISCR